MTGEDQNGPVGEQHHSDVEFIIINNAEFIDGKIKSPRNTGIVIDWDSRGTGMLTDTPLQPGDMVQVNNGGTYKTGIVMWSVESSNKFRVQMRFV